MSSQSGAAPKISRMTDYRFKKFWGIFLRFYLELLR
ncbi:hypothetical protein BACCAP_01533 [Pseudoflavonifractor capillosus ATCC 29799]|uniref:Uncharacterized protein n=1 Tax=Pseudoflavonifractor capillosus ATCC 29799 TaxID=411467 RepID=A6NTK4_9FIRM|nr:hypothetical protein BACCAP_01533 [Pseudoflavonifractor capillosus ATCC 29799]